MVLPTNIVSKTPNHADLHNSTNEVVNKLSRDTGRLNLSSLLINGWTATSVEIQRQDDRAYLRVAGLNGSQATNSRFLAMPVGFQPPYVVETHPQRDSSNTFKQGITLSLSGGFTLPTGVILGSSTREISWACLESWPTTLPGTTI